MWLRILLGPFIMRHHRKMLANFPVIVPNFTKLLQQSRFQIKFRSHTKAPVRLSSHVCLTTLLPVTRTSERTGVYTLFSSLSSGMSRLQLSRSSSSASNWGLPPSLATWEVILNVRFTVLLIVTLNTILNVKSRSPGHLIYKAMPSYYFQRWLSDLAHK